MPAFTFDSAPVGAKQGKRLKSLPPLLKDDEVVLGLKQVSEWLSRHRAACQAEVDRWMTRSLPVAAEVLAQVWLDEAWREALRDLIVVPVAADGTSAVADGGFLREVDPDRGLGVVDLDGNSVWLNAAQYAIPHPVHLAELDELREFAVELGVEQGMLQLFREIWRKPEDPVEQAKSLLTYANGHFAQMRHLIARATSLSYPVRGGNALCRIWEEGRTVNATVWVGDGDPGYETWTGDLTFADGQGQLLSTADVPPVAWSEGMRMAAALYAGRVVEQEA
jgi:hypothetical protein